MKILILKFKTIGDVLLTTPLIRNLKIHYPESLIDVAVNKGTEDMLALNLNVSQIIVYNRVKNRQLSTLKRIYEEYKFLKNIRKSKYDIVIDLDHGDRGAGIASISGAKIKVGSSNIKSKLVRNTYTHFLPSRKGKHIVEVGLDAARTLNIPIKDKKLEIFWSKDDENTINSLSLDNEFIHVHPLSRAYYKEVSNKIIASIVDYCELELGFKVVLTSAPIDRELGEIDNILDLCQSSPINLSGKLTLKQTAALNKRAKLFIGVDTAVMHISAANNTPVLAFFGPTSPDNWGPWDNDIQKSLYCRDGGTQKTGKHTVYSKKIQCMPCNNLGCNDSHISQCLISLDIDDVKTSIKSML
ncbi:MAG TPA: putative lipopolysaccharide heptosyltransferase III [Flavobacteriaceae bacterium]|nr:putative lipopolysaccharide heptosyltransferase III [Flavobacteriaceae bacterium]